jgi:phosphatidate cytidylyltransferase
MSNLPKRILIGLIGIPVILFLAFTGRDPFFYFTLVVSVLALYEFYSLFEKKGFSLLIYFFLPVSTAVYILLYSNLFDAPPVIITYLVLVFTVEIFKKDHSPVNVFIITGGFVYIMIPLLMLNSLTDILIADSGINLVMMIFILIWICDSAAYFGGKSYGKKQLSAISPKKTIEGSVTGFTASLIFSAVLYFIFPDKLEFKDFIIVGALTGIFSQVGDLFESMIKRYCGVKDSSGIIPGHGGVLDRFDSLILVTPIIFAYVYFVL